MTGRNRQAENRFVLDQRGKVEVPASEYRLLVLLDRDRKLRELTLVGDEEEVRDVFEGELQGLRATVAHERQFAPQFEARGGTAVTIDRALETVPDRPRVIAQTRAQARRITQVQAPFDHAARAGEVENVDQACCGGCVRQSAWRAAG